MEMEMKFFRYLNTIKDLNDICDCVKNNESVCYIYFVMFEISNRLFSEKEYNELSMKKQIRKIGFDFYIRKINKNRFVDLIHLLQAEFFIELYKIKRQYNFQTSYLRQYDKNNLLDVWEDVIR